MDDLISRRAAIDALCEEPEVWSGKDEYGQGLNNQWHYDVNALKNVPTAQRWIPCSERLPEKDGLYIVSVINDHNRIYSKTCWYHGHEKWFARQDVIAWMPLPEPYREDGDNDG